MLLPLLTANDSGYLTYIVAPGVRNPVGNGSASVARKPLKPPHLKLPLKRAATQIQADAAREFAPPTSEGSYASARRGGCYTQTYGTAVSDFVTPRPSRRRAASPSWPSRHLCCHILWFSRFEPPRAFPRADHSPKRYRWWHGGDGGYPCTSSSRATFLQTTNWSPQRKPSGRTFPTTRTVVSYLRLFAHTTPRRNWRQLHPAQGLLCEELGSRVARR